MVVEKANSTAHTKYIHTINSQPLSYCGLPALARTDGHLLNHIESNGRLLEASPQRVVAAFGVR
jgi:hypothetical protein